MKFAKLFIITILALFFLEPSFAAQENVFYVLHHNEKTQLKALNSTLARIRENPSSINIVISQAYKITSKGDVEGYLNQELIDVAKAHSIKLMAMVVNAGFDQKKLHLFLSSKKAQGKALKEIIAACKKLKLYGVQFDFENISVKDKKALTAFFEMASTKLHKEKLAVSFAVVPAVSDQPGPSVFLKKNYQNWTGAYDLKALGKYADFITIMSYNQHPDGTTPGPLATISWVEKTVKHALKYIPAHKISLGIPAYSTYWYTGLHPARGKKLTTQRLEISYKEADQIVKKINAKFIWNDNEKVNFAIYQRNWLNEFMYVEDAASFKAKQELATKYQLRGISVFRIGTEDKRIWAMLGNK